MCVCFLLLNLVLLNSGPFYDANMHVEIPTLCVHWRKLFVIQFRPYTHAIYQNRLDPRPGRCVVSLSKRHLLPKSNGNTQE